MLGEETFKRINLEAFKREWLAVTRKSQKLALQKRYKLNPTQFYQVLHYLNLPNYTDSVHHPGRRKLFERIKKSYKSGHSTFHIAHWTHFNEEHVRKILIAQGVRMREAKITNVLLTQTTSPLPNIQLNKQIIDRYLYKRMNSREIAAELGISEETVRKRITALGYPIYVRRKTQEKMDFLPNYNIIGIVKGESEPFRFINEPERDYEFVQDKTKRTGVDGFCWWCKKKYPKYIIKGPKAQRFCSSSCKNKARG
jgi:hypothetical protein